MKFRTLAAFLTLLTCSSIVWAQSYTATQATLEQLQRAWSDPALTSKEIEASFGTLTHQIKPRWRHWSPEQKARLSGLLYRFLTESRAPAQSPGDMAKSVLFDEWITAQLIHPMDAWHILKMPQVQKLPGIANIGALIQGQFENHNGLAHKTLVRCLEAIAHLSEKIETAINPEGSAKNINIPITWTHIKLRAKTIKRLASEATQNLNQDPMMSIQQKTILNLNFLAQEFLALTISMKQSGLQPIAGQTTINAESLKLHALLKNYVLYWISATHETCQPLFYFGPPRSDQGWVQLAL